MDLIARNIGALSKALAILIVFLISISIPLMFSISLQRQAKDFVIKSDLNQIKNWAEIYRIKNGTYEGLVDDFEIKRTMQHIYEAGGVCSIFSNRTEYCAKTVFNNNKQGTLCIDSLGYSGKDALNCNSNKSAHCQ